MNPFQAHLLSVHVPVLGSLAATALFLAARIARNETLFKTACVTVLLSTLGALAAFLSGPPAFELLEGEFSLDPNTIETHAALGKGAFMGLVLLGMAALLTLLQYGQGESPAGWLRWLLLLASLLLAYMLAWTAHEGGMAAHPEIGESLDFLFPRL